MTFIGDPFHHVPSEPEDAPFTPCVTCLYCGENWPCEPVLIKRAVIERVITEIAVSKAPSITMAGHSMVHRDLLIDEIRELI